MRLLHASRLSRVGDAATGTDKQEEAATRYADVHGHEIVATAADNDVSGSIAPKARPQLGPWLTEPARMAQYDGIVAAYLDRLGRNARQLSELRDWAEDNGKRLTVISPSLRWPPEEDDLASPIIWDVLARLAEYELRAITTRNRETRKWLQDNDYFVGRPPWGYRVVPKDGHKTLEPDPALVPYMRGMVDRALEGMAQVNIGRWLDSEGIGPLHGGIWTTRSIGNVLRNPILYGRRKSSNGRTVLRVDPVIDYGTWKRLQDVLNINPRRRGPTTRAPALLAKVAYCAKCGGIMHYRHTKKPSRRGDKFYEYEFYRCDGTQKKPSTCKNWIHKDDLEQWVSEWFHPAAPLGNLPLLERTVIPGSGHEDEIEQVGQDMQELTAQYASGEIDDAEYDDALTRLRNERKRLLALPDEPNRVEEQPTGKTVAEHWRELDTAGQREFLLSAGLTVHAEMVDMPSGRRMRAKLIPTDVDAFESTMRYGKRGVTPKEPWKRKGARLVVPAD